MFGKMRLFLNASTINIHFLGKKSKNQKKYIENFGDSSN